jgi:hypothetical protein
MPDLGRQSTDAEKGVGWGWRYVSDGMQQPCVYMLAGMVARTYDYLERSPWTCSPKEILRQTWFVQLLFLGY